MKLFLASHAARMMYDMIFEFGLNPVETRVAFIPNAADRYDDPWFMKQDYELMKSLGFQLKIIDLKESHDAFLYNQLCKTDLIFVAGGNTFDLLHAAESSGFLQQARGLIEDGIPYAGSSAGSVLAAGDLSLIRSIDPVHEDLELNTITGLDLIDFLPLPHLGNSKYGDSFADLFSDGQTVWQPVIAFTDYQAVVVDDNGIRIIEQRKLPSAGKK
ncbi:MAG: putative peptidase [candidate division WS6 bacterium OLB20]|uniref:Putative peptidase n=1 Tax=candidate division WS6 bacterium OLB20 TaxID=1617426 RepID=A0A136M005_9BACT|nr:MAG: putative peptidase [candidate division WS6 bacterium OLB20]